MVKKTTIIEDPPISENTPGVVAYRVGQLEKAVNDGFKEHNDKLDQLVANFATQADLVSVSARVSDLESDRKWVVRLVLGAVLVAVLSLIGVGLKYKP